MLATLLKARQDVGYFPVTEEVHADTAAHLALQLGLAASVWPAVTHKTKSLYRYQAAVRTYLSVTPYDDVARDWLRKPFSRRPKP
jgi:regulator of sigma D